MVSKNTPGASAPRFVLVHALAAVLPAAAAGAQTGWAQSATSGPSIRHSAGLAYDSARGVAVLFGGLDGDRRTFTTLLGDTWEWNGAEWTRVAATGPSPRMGHAMAYDARREVVVLFGGSDGVFRGDTWEWDGRTWRQVATEGPSPRSRHGMAYDSRRGVVVLFGRIPREDSETWEWDGGVWRRVATSGPSPRSRSPLAYDESRGVTVLFGGRDPSGVNLDDTWEWDGASWSLVARGGPRGRSRHALAWDGALGVTRLAAGLSGRDTWEWDGASWQQVAATGGPGARLYPAFAHHAARGTLVLFGGWDGSAARSDTWEYAGQPPCQMPVAFGCGTPHCDGLVRLSTSTCPRVGELGFSIEVSNGVPDLSAASTTFASIGIRPDPGASLGCSSPPAGRLCFNIVPLGVNFQVAVDERGRGTLALPIPNEPSLRGAEVYAQLVSVHPVHGCPCVVAPSLGLTSSRGLSVRVQ